ncbi:MAG: hypothetical protein V4674_00735 [Patescibacteria group bacterium]
MDNVLIEKALLVICIVIALALIGALERVRTMASKRAEQQLAHWKATHPGATLEWDEPQAILLKLIRARAKELTHKEIVHREIASSAGWELLCSELAMLVPRNKNLILSELRATLPPSLSGQLPGL